MKHVVIAGGGFAGVRLARKLRSRKDVRVTLINNSPDFRYYPAMYRAATGYKMGASRVALEWMLLNSSNIDIVIDSVVSNDTQKKELLLASGKTIGYDYVVFALGSVTTYFNVEGLHEHSFGIKSPEEILTLRAHLHGKVVGNSPEQYNYVVVGAGPTGVELAGSLGSYLQHIAKKHRRRNHKITLWLVEAAPRVVPQLGESASRRVKKRLEKLGVKILTDTKVEAETINELRTSTGPIKSHTVIWTAGTALNPFFAQSVEDFPLGEHKRVKVGEHFDVNPVTYVVGDNASTKFSGLAYTAIKDADFVADDICRRIAGKSRKARVDHRPVSVVPTGRGWAVLQYGSLVLSGWLMSLVRGAADLIGYVDVMGVMRGLTIWSNSELTEDGCTICHRSK